MKVAIFGLGYVGTVTAACLAADDHDVWGVDVDQDKVAMVSAGKSPVVEPGLSELVARGVASGRLHATASAAEAVDGADVSLICVGTPSNAHGGTNLDYLYRVVDDLSAALLSGTSGSSRYHTVVVRSTVPPGTIDAIGWTLAAKLEGSSVAAGVAMCPEFLREGTGIRDFYAPPYTIVGSEDPRAAEAVQKLFGFIGRPLHVVETQVAESLKYAANAFHATKVCFANEMGRVLQRYGVDTRRVMELFCEDHQLNISSSYLRPGFAFGGSCLPKDLRSLLHLARVESIDLPMLSGVLASNRLSITEIVDRVIECEGKSVALLGLSFKMDSDDLRESPYVELAETLLGKGYLVRIYDPIAHPGNLVGANRRHVESKLPHLRSILADDPTDAIRNVEIAIVSIPSREVIDALLADPPPHIIDLDGRLGAQIESLQGYQGASW